MGSVTFDEAPICSFSNAQFQKNHLSLGWFLYPVRSIIFQEPSWQRTGRKFKEKSESDTKYYVISKFKSENEEISRDYRYHTSKNYFCSIVDHDSTSFIAPWLWVHFPNITCSFSVTFSCIPESTEFAQGFGVVKFNLSTKSISISNSNSWCKISSSANSDGLSSVASARIQFRLYFKQSQLIVRHIERFFANITVAHSLERVLVHTFHFSDEVKVNSVRV